MIPKLIILTTICVLQMTVAVAQIQHDQQYTLYVPPEMSIRALRGDQLEIHPETAADVTMSNSMWWASTTSATGSTIRFTTDTPFVNQSRPEYKRDVRLHSPRLIGTPRAGWQYDIPTSQTDYATGNEQAAVQISGSNPGVALIYLEVTFITGDLPTLAGGDYVVTVTGTITAN